jgi:hypothetical protein
VAAEAAVEAVLEVVAAAVAAEVTVIRARATSRAASTSRNRTVAVPAAAVTAAAAAAAAAEARTTPRQTISRRTPGGATPETLDAAAISPAAPVAVLATNRVARRFDQLTPAELTALATPLLEKWRSKQRHALAADRVKDRIANTLSAGVSLATFAFGLQSLGYKPGTIVKYLSLAKQLVPWAKDDRELTRLTRHFAGTSNAERAARTSRALTTDQIRLLVGDLSTVQQWAMRITWLTASRASDWDHVKVRFHKTLIEIRYVTQWKSDPMLKRRIVKWLPRGGADSPRLWHAAVLMLVRDRASILTHIRTVAPDLGCHSLRHGAIVFLEEQGNSVESIATLTNHAPCKRFSALQDHYFAPWSPSTSSKSLECQRMAAQLLAALESP